MNISHDDATRDMHKIKQLLHELGLTDITVEYPAYLSIVWLDGREFHAGYTFGDEDNDTAEFQIYDANDGVYGERFATEFLTHYDLQFIADKTYYLLNAYLSND